MYLGALTSNGLHLFTSKLGGFEGKLYDLHHHTSKIIAHDDMIYFMHVGDEERYGFIVLVDPFDFDVVNVIEIDAYSGYYINDNIFAAVSFENILYFDIADTSDEKLIGYYGEITSDDDDGYLDFDDDCAWVNEDFDVVTSNVAEFEYNSLSLDFYYESDDLISSISSWVSYEDGPIFEDESSVTLDNYKYLYDG